MTSVTPIPSITAPETSTRRQALRSSAEALEESFLAEMLRLSGVARPPESGGGGAGEEAFAGFLADAYAAELAESGGVGLAEGIYQSLLAREPGAGSR